jgi:hypothetical protein
MTAGASWWQDDAMLEGGDTVAPFKVVLRKFRKINPE